jgi:hypothetical protein
VTEVDSVLGIKDIRRTYTEHKEVRLITDYNLRTTYKLGAVRTAVVGPAISLRNPPPPQYHEGGKMTGPTMCETRWSTIVELFQKNSDDLLTRHPHCIEEIDLLQTALLTIGQLIHISPPVNGEGAVWKELVTKSVVERRVLCKHLEGKALFTVMLRMYAAILRELREFLLPVLQQSSEEFRE